ncbi:MAG: hypothetical protein GX477_07550 [Clostridiaceae bacterium]|nr:hypothetical protein [Clostridiaceae bacterium]
MFNFYNRYYIFRQNDGQFRDFRCDAANNLCSSILGRSGIWSDMNIIARDVHPYFCAEPGRDGFYHVLYQDNSGNINYSKTDGHYVKTFPVLGSRTPSVYNKHLRIVPLGDEVYMFYVLQHDNSFLLAYQQLKNNRPGTPKIVDYVSANSIPCTVLHDPDRNIYAFYQSYDGKYLQLGYKKFSTARKHWSDFTAVTKYQGDCEYPHAIMDPSGTIHLCYQRRAPKLFELVYQQKAPGRNLWSAETVLHSSVHPFDNASVLHVNDRIIVYWVRNDIIYWCSGSMSGDSWTRPARYGFQPGRRLRCISYTDLAAAGGPGYGDGPASRQRLGDGPSHSLSPGVFPGIVNDDGFTLAFMDAGGITGGRQFPHSRQLAVQGRDASGNELKSLVLNIFRKMQEKMGEMKAEWEEIKNEIPGLTSAYMELEKETEKLSLRLSLLENRLSQAAGQCGRTGLSGPAAGQDKSVLPEDCSGPAHGRPDRSPGYTGPVTPRQKTQQAADENAGATGTTAPAAGDRQKVHGTTEARETSAERPKPSLDPEAMKIWEEWQEPAEWTGGDVKTKGS